MTFESRNNVISDGCQQLNVSHYPLSKLTMSFTNFQVLLRALGATFDLKGRKGSWIHPTIQIAIPLDSTVAMILQDFPRDTVELNFKVSLFVQFIIRCYLSIEVTP